MAETRRFGLRTQVLLSLGALTLAALLMAHFLVRQVYRSAMLDDRVRAASALTSTMMPFVPGRGEHQGRLREFLSRLRHPSDVLGAFVLDEYLRDELRDDRFSPGGLADEATLRNLAGVGKPATMVLNGSDGERIVAMAPVPGADPPRYLLLVLSTAEAQDRLGSFEVLSLLVVFLVLVLVVAVGNIFMSRLIVQPVHRMVRTVEQVTRGELGAGTAHEWGVEMDSLAAALGRMTERLREDRGKIESQIAELKRVNMQLRAAQEHLVRTEKLASVGRLAAGIAHEIGNPISIILGYLEILLQGGSTEEERLEHLRQIDKATKRIHEIIRDLLDYSRPVPEGITFEDVRPAVHDAVNLLKPQKKFRAVKVELRLPDSLVPAQMNRGRLVQVLVNLLLNAADAMQGKGSVEVAARREGPTVVLAVRDHGPGIAEEDLLRVFDPFFTTKQPGEGTGLGLSVSYSIIRSFKGDMTVRSEPGQGAEFEIRLIGE